MNPDALQFLDEMTAVLEGELLLHQRSSKRSGRVLACLWLADDLREELLKIDGRCGIDRRGPLPLLDNETETKHQSRLAEL